MTETGPLIVYSTVATPEAARELADGVIAAGLAACVNILTGVTSVFRWEPDGGDPAQAGVQAETEVMVLMKTSRAAYPDLEAHLRREHPYELPEIVAVPMSHGLPAFLQWIDASTTPS